jgi:GNAT superfamily N-acetyltransferase
MATVLQYASVETFNPFDSTEPCTVDELRQEHEKEVLDFLAASPIHTVLMASLIRDNGLVSPHNRGSFYACRDRQERLEGVALIGQITVADARTDAALSAFARLACHCLSTHLIRGERKTVSSFWKHYAGAGQEPRLISRELLLEQREPLPLDEPIEELRPATLTILDQVLKVNAAMAFQEAGVSPLHRDPGGFRQRTARRIEQGRVWAWVQEERLMFKADVVGETPQAIYLEGVYVHPEERLKGYGLRGLTQLGSSLLARSKSICLTVNQQNRKALAFYAKAGYQFHSHYETIYPR